MFPEGRSIGVTEALHGSVPDPVLVLFALLTQLGDVWFLFLLGGMLYVAGDELPGGESTGGAVYSSSASCSRTSPSSGFSRVLPVSAPGRGG